jgi:translocation and assembly module TamB
MSLRKRSAPSGFALRAVVFAGRSLGIVVVFLLSAVLGVLLHLGTPPARRVAMAEVNAILAPSFQGQIRIERLGGLGLFGVSGTNVTIADPDGRPVLAVSGVRVRLATLGAIRSALFQKRGPLTIELSNVTIDALDARLDTDAAGTLDLINAFAPSKPSPPPDPNARGMRLDVSHIALRHTWAHGQMAGAPPLDVELNGLRGSFTYAPDFLEGAISEATIAAHRIANGADVAGSLVARVKKPSDASVDPDGDLTWQGTVGSIAESIHASFVHNRIDAVVDAPAIAPDDVRTVWPDSPVRHAASAHAEAHGPLSSVDFGLHAGVGDAALDASGAASIGDEKTIHVSIQAHGIDAHEFVESVPPSRLGLTGNASADMSAKGSLKSELTLAFLGGPIGGSTAPPASIHATASRPDPKDLRADVEVVVDQPGAPTELTAHVVPTGDSSAVAFDLTSTVADFDRLPQLGHSVRGNAKLDARGSLDTGSMTVDAVLRASAGGVVQGPNHLGSAVLDAHAHGAVASPTLDANLRARDVDAAGRHFVSVDIGATGQATRPHVTVSTRGPDTPDIDAGGDVALGPGVSLSEVRVGLARAGEQARVSVARVTASGGDIDVKDARVEGVGEPATATVTLSRGALRMRVATEGIDLARVGRLAHLEKTLKSGIVGFDADVNLQRDGGQGHAMLDVRRAAAAGVQDINGHLDVTFDRRKLVGKVHAEAAAIGTMDLDAEKVELGGGGPLSAASWRAAWGHLDFSVRADLARVAALMPPEDLPVSEARGDVTLKGRIGRDDIHDMTPDLSLSVETDHLVLAGKTPTARDIDGVMVYPPPPWRLAGVDFAINAQINGKKGDVNVVTHSHDAKGTLADLTLDIPHFPFDDVFNRATALAADLHRMPFDVKIAVPERGLGGIPDMLKQPYVSGKLKADLNATGTIEAPKVNLTAALRNSRSAANAMARALDVDFEAHYDGRQGQASAKARSGDKEVLDAEVRLDAAVASFLDATGGPAPWKASARAHLAGFPVEAIAAVDDKLVAGAVSGDITVADLHENGHADAALSVDGLRIGTINYKTATIRGKADGKVIDGSVRIDQKDGFVETKAHAVASWGTALAPALDPAQPLGVTLSSKNFRIAAFLPFVESTLDELDGRLDAETRIELDPQARGAHLSGHMGLSRGTVEAVAGGGELHDLTASVTFSPDGTITLEKLSGAGMTGRFEANGSARLEGTTLQSAKGVIVIPSKSPIPLSVGGSELGNIDGRIEVTENATNAKGGMEVKVNVPQLRVAVPEGSTSSAQSLGMPDNVRIGAHRGSPSTFVLLPLDPPVQKQPPEPGAAPTALAIETNLADVEVVRGSQLKIDLDGHVNVKAAEKSSVTGQIHLKRGGMLSVKGKNFTVESGTVTFVDDPANPEVVVKAGWTAPEGTTVYANFVGPLKTGKVTLTSEPKLPQQEIVQLLLFGSADGQQAQTPSGSPENSAVGAAGGEAAQPLNHALGQLGLGAVTTNVDTTDSANPKPEVEIQIARDLSIQLAIVLGQPLPGVNPDTVLLSLDWRFVKKWTLSSTLGDAGTTIFDLLWQKRY